MKKVWTVIISVAALAAIGLYIFDIIYNNSPYLEHLFKVLIVVFSSVSAIIRINSSSKRKSLEFYESFYTAEIGNAFIYNTFKRKKLLCAIRLYNENSYKKAIKYLYSLMKDCKYTDDAQTVLLFGALCYSDAGHYEKAVELYNSLLKYQPQNARNYNNIGMLHMKMGNNDKAMEYFLTAVRIDDSYAAAYNNIASLFFKESNHESAVFYAKKALEAKNDLNEASALLAIIYALEGDEENKKKYFRISVTSGKNADELSEAIKHYLKENE